jgi:hypothetical protein
MNQHFNLMRFGRLLRKHTAEHLRSYLMGVAVLAGGIGAVLGGLTYMGGPLPPGAQLILFYCGLITAGAMITAGVFAALGDPRRAAPALLLPASHLEKYLVVWLYSLPVFWVVYVGVFLAMDALTLQLAPAGSPRIMLDFAAAPQLLGRALLSYALLHAAALSCALYFERLHIVKTAFALLGGLGVLALLNFQVLKRVLTVDIAPALPFDDVGLVSGGQYFGLALPAGHGALLAVAVLPLALAVLLWLGAYARLTEKQL